MRVSITKESKRILTLADMPAVKGVLESVEEDDLEEYAKMAARLAFGDNNRVQKLFGVTAEIAKNRRVWNQYHGESVDLDIWIQFTAQMDDGFVVGGAYLTDIWSISGDEKGDAEIRKHMFIRRFVEAK